MEKFKITKRTDGEFQYVLKASNGETILTSEGYVSHSGCKRGIDACRIAALDNQNFKRRTAQDGQYYFRLVAANYEIIGTSELYTTAVMRDKGIEAVMAAAPGAMIDDRT